MPDGLPVGGGADGLEGVGAAAEVEEVELVGGRLLELGPLEVDAADPVALGLEVGDEVVADEAAGAGDDDARERAVVAAVRAVAMRGAIHEDGGLEGERSAEAASDQEADAGACEEP